AWTAAVWLQPGWAEAILLFAALVAVPLGLALVDQGSEARQLLSTGLILQLPAAILLTVAFTLPAGIVAAALSIPWLAVTFLIALEGVARFRERGNADASAACIDVGHIY